VARPGGEVQRPAVAVPHGHAVLVEGDDRRLQVELLLQVRGRLEDLVVAVEQPAGGDAGLEAVGGDGGAAVVLAVVVAADRVGQHAHAERPGVVDDGRQQAGRADALVVVADEDDVALAQVAVDDQADLVLDRVADGPAVLVIDAEHLLRVPVLGAADVALLDGGGPARVADDPLVVDPLVGQHLADAAAVVVAADDAGQHHPGAERPQHGRHAARAAEPLLAPVGPQQDHRRLLADALGVAPDVAVEHQVAEHQHARLAEVLHQVDQFLGHRSLLGVFLVVSRVPTAGNPKLEIRNPKQMPMTKKERTKTPATGLAAWSFAACPRLQ
jgi:hypothetical protein